ncbi:MAG: hypothetical protein AAF732_23905 [Pseudomonadota bacterium]
MAKLWQQRFSRVNLAAPRDDSAFQIVTYLQSLVVGLRKIHTPRDHVPFSKNKALIVNICTKQTGAGAAQYGHTQSRKTQFVIANRRDRKGQTGQLSPIEFQTDSYQIRRHAT